MKLKNGVIIQKMGESYVAFDNNSSTLHELNETAYRILLLLESGVTEASDIKKRLINEYKVSKRVAQKDVEAFLNLLKKKDLIVKK